jgi:hypothetical protein
MESLQQLKGEEFVSDTMSYITLKGSWCDIITLNAHGPTEDKDDIQDSYYEGLEQVFDHQEISKKWYGGKTFLNQ